MDITDVTAGIALLVPGDEHPIGDSEKTLAANQTLPVYSKYFPEILTQDISGDGTKVYDIFSVLTGWQEGYSSVLDIEYPVDDDLEPVILDSDIGWYIQQFPSGKRLRFVNDTPETTESFRVFYTAIKTFALVYPQHEEAIKSLAASYFADMLATYYAQTSDSMISADSVNHKSMSDQYAARAKILRKYFFDSIGVKEGAQADTLPACAFANWDLPEVRITYPHV